MHCPLCESDNIEVLETINQKDLVYLKKLTGIDFSYLIDRNIDYCECRECKLRFYNPLITGDEKFYNALQKFEWYYQDNKEEFKFASKFIGEKDKILEIGSGKGAFTKYIKTKDYVGLDFSERAKELAAKNDILIENTTIEDFAKKMLRFV